MTNSKNTILHVRERSLIGKQSKKLHKDGYIAGNIFGLNQPSEVIEIHAPSFSKLVAEHGDTTLMYLQVGENKQIPALIDEVQYHAVTGEAQHVAFKRVNLKVKVTAEIPVETVGEFSVAQATVVLTRNVLEIEALPADLPDVFEVDISQLKEVGQTIMISDLVYDREKISIQLSEEELASPLVIVQEVLEEVEEVAEPAETSEAETAPTGETTAESTQEQKAE